MLFSINALHVFWMGRMSEKAIAAVEWAVMVMFSDFPWKTVKIDRMTFRGASGSSWSD